MPFSWPKEERGAWGRRGRRQHADLTMCGHSVGAWGNTGQGRGEHGAGVWGAVHWELGVGLGSVRRKPEELGRGQLTDSLLVFRVRAD